MTRRLAGLAGTLALAAAAAFAVVPAASAQDSYPDRPITIYVGFAPGASTDGLARQLQPRMSELLGQPVVIENRPGSGGVQAAGHVARAEPDGYSLLLTVHAPIVMAPYLFANLPFDPTTDFTPIVALVESKLGLAVASHVPVETVEELVEYARSNPVHFGSAGIGSAHHIAGEQINRAAGIEMVHVPYSGGGPAVQDLVGGHIEASFGTLVALLPHVESGDIRLIALVENERWDEMPDLPTVAEVYPEVRRDNWIGILAPAGTPDAIVQRIYEAAADAVQQPEIVQQLANQGSVVVIRPPAEFQAEVLAQVERFGEIIPAVGIEPQ